MLSSYCVGAGLYMGGGGGACFFQRVYKILIHCVAAQLHMNLQALTPAVAGYGRCHPYLHAPLPQGV
jgi:hypothetical protein